MRSISFSDSSRMNSVSTLRSNTKNLILHFSSTPLSTLTPNHTSASKPYSLNIHLILIFLVTLMALLTIAGNLLVIIAFIRESSIRTYSNHFILNLSIADLLIGLICIPLYAHEFISGQWYLGYHLCKLWLFFDYIVGSASTLCIVVISYDRYQMVSEGLTYFSSVSTKRALKFMLGTWIIAILNYGPAIVLWDWLPGSDPFQYNECDPPFAKNFPYLVTTAFVEFFVPFFSLIILNFLVYLSIRQRSHGLMRTNTMRLKTLTFDHENLLEKSLPSSPTIPTVNHFSKSHSLARDRKAAKNLFIFVFVFVISWCPYTLFSLIRALCKNPDKCISPRLYEVTFWLLWLNSTINPLLYSFLHVKFRQAYYRILCFHSTKSRPNR